MLLHTRPLGGYRELNPTRLAGYLSALPELAGTLGGRPQLWEIEQVADNDMNLVFRVAGPNGRLCVKQAVPSVSLGGQTIRVPLERTIYEEAALGLYRRIVRELVPRVLHYDSELYMLVLEWLEPHRPLRSCLIEGGCIEHFPERIGTFMADTLFATSDLGMPAVEKRERLAFFCGNSELRQLSEELIFIAPFGSSGTPAWLSPELDFDVRTVRNDPVLKRAVADLHLKFLSEPQALLHGDLHTGSVMVSDTDLKVIDAEFAAFGPMGFDLGLLLGNLLIAYFSQDGHGSADAPRDQMEEWLLAATVAVWATFETRFLARWREAGEGDAAPAALFEGPGGQQARLGLERDYMRRVFEDALRFAGLAMVRRVLGCRPARDLASIGDRAQRAAAERKTLLLGAELVKDAHHVLDLEEVAHVARQIRSGTIVRA